MSDYMLESALRLAREGVAVHWLHNRDKNPVGSGWSKKPINTVADLEHSYREGRNIGIRLGRFSEVAKRLYLYCYDVDIKGDDEDVRQAYAALRKLLPEWKLHPAVESGRRNGSLHVYFVSDVDMASKKLIHSTQKVKWVDGKGEERHSWRWEIELFGTKKQVVCPPSIHPDTGEEYVWAREIDWDDLDSIYIHPDDIAGSDGEESDERPSTRPSGSSRSLQDAAARKPMALSKKQIISVLEGLHDDWCFDYDKWLKVGMALHHQYEGSDEGLERWHWFSRSDEEKYDPEDLDDKWKGFGQGDFAGQKPVRFATLMKYSKAEPTEAAAANDETAEDAVIRVDRKHALIRHQGKTLVLNEESDGRITWSRKPDFLDWYHSDRVDMWGPPNAKGQSKIIQVSVGKLWWDSNSKRRFEGVTMDPSEKTGLYNLWRGFSVDPDPESSCELFLDHIHDNVCDGDYDLYKWVIAWMAHMIQRPWEKPGVALVLKGKMGVGKTIIGEVLMELLRWHTIKVSQAKHLTGAFNAHLAHALLVRVEEAFWVGDKAGANVLKDMVTGSTVRVENKGVDSAEIPSFHRFVFTSNEHWVIPAGMEERRFAVIDVKTYQMKNQVYFGALVNELRAGGYGALLHYLQNVDISKINVRTPPVTAALAEQKIASLSGFDAWWAECLFKGTPPASHIHFGDAEGGWEDNALTLPTSELRDDYEKWLKARKYGGDPIVAQLFSRRLIEYCPSIHNTKLRNGKSRVPSVVLPPLDVCRAEFEKHFGQKVFTD